MVIQCNQRHMCLQISIQLSRAGRLQTNPALFAGAWKGKQQWRVEASIVQGLFLVGTPGYSALSPRKPLSGNHLCESRAGAEPGGALAHCRLWVGQGAGGGHEGWMLAGWEMLAGIHTRSGHGGQKREKSSWVLCDSSHSLLGLG